MMLETNRIIQGDCAVVMKEIPSDSITLTVTSPPYDALDDDWQPIEKTRDYDGYVFNFTVIAKELYRITKPGGVVAWIVGDKVIKGKDGGQTESLTPLRQVEYFKDVIGFNVDDTMIYAKDARYEEKNRYRQSFEYIFILVKGKPNKYNLLKDHLNISFVVHKWRRNHAANRKQDGEMAVHRDYNVQAFGYRENIWYYQNGYFKSTLDKEAFEHPAVMPEALAEDLILTYSNEGDIVFDPMAGSGTTLKAAERLRRKWLGIEGSSKYIDIIKKRLDLYVNNERITTFQT